MSLPTATRLGFAVKLARARSLDAWKVEPVARGRYLVQARDLEPWYSDTDPDPDVLAAARADFGDMILTHDAIKAHGQPRRA